MTETLEAYIKVQLIGGHEIEAIIDTGFDGEMILPQEMVEEWGLPVVTSTVCHLADGSPARATTFSAQIEWLGEVQRVDVIAMNTFLIGTKLLAGTRLTIDYEAGTVLIEKN